MLRVVCAVQRGVHAFPRATVTHVVNSTVYRPVKFGKKASEQLDVHTLDFPGFDKRAGPVQIQVLFGSSQFLDQGIQRLPNQEEPKAEYAPRKAGKGKQQQKGQKKKK
eukprot:m.239393 g.239393  ORF g.239393 m.239393 type:complete len:108 (+) comp13477_c0_seq1:24-347(+)